MQLYTRKKHLLPNMINIQEFSTFSIRGKNKLIKEYGKIIDQTVFKNTTHTLIYLNGSYLIGVGNVNEIDFLSFKFLNNLQKWFCYLPLNFN